MNNFWPFCIKYVLVFAHVFIVRVLLFELDFKLQSTNFAIIKRHTRCHTNIIFNIFVEKFELSKLKKTNNKRKYIHIKLQVNWSLNIRLQNNVYKLMFIIYFQTLANHS